MNRRNFLLILAASPALLAAGNIDFLSNRDAAAGLRQALEQGASEAVEALGAPDGFFGDARFRIPLPDALARAEPFMRAIGQGKRLDDLHLAMNRAAESAVAQARPLLVSAVKQMSVQDAKRILAGGESSVTDYFRSKTTEPLTQKFRPIVARAIAKLELAEQYNRIAAQAVAVGLLKSEDAKVENHVTRYAVDALYARIAEEERAIRANPAEAIGAIARKVFGAMGK